MHTYEVLLRPLITEKTQWQVGYERPQYAFEVDKRATKADIKAAVEAAFPKVTVERVNVVNVPLKRRRSRKSGTTGRKAAHVVRSQSWKKAIVQVTKDSRIELFEGVA